MTNKIPITVIIVTKNAADHIAACLAPLSAFAQVLVVDSYSEDNTVEIAQQKGATSVLYQWNGKYPKKRQWCLDELDIQHDWVFFVDADEVLTSDLIQEIRCMFHADASPDEAGFFVCGEYIWNGRRLRFGLKNNKIALFHRKRMKFPVVDDLDCTGMGEIEGHYQPICIDPAYHGIGQLTHVLLHDACRDQMSWLRRHRRYAAWEICMNKKYAWPEDPVMYRQWLKRFLRSNPLRPEIAFVHSYILKCGFMDGKAGLVFAVSRWRYYQMIRAGQIDISVQ
mgnify:CR=1 FL=1